MRKIILIPVIIFTLLLTMISDNNAAIFNWGSARVKNSTVTVANGLSIQEVIDSVTDAASDRTYVVIVPPGTYTEQVTMKQYVSLRGETGNGSIITSATGPVLTLASNADLLNLSIKCSDANSYCIDTGTATSYWSIKDCYIESLTGSGMLFRTSGTATKSWKQAIHASVFKTNKIGIYASTGYGYLDIHNMQIQLVGQSSGNDHVGIRVDENQRLIMLGGQIFSSWDVSERIEEAANNVYGVYIPSTNSGDPRIHLNAVEIMVRNETATQVNAIRAEGTSSSGFIRIRGGMYQVEDGEANDRTPIVNIGSNLVQIIGTQLSGLWSALYQGSVNGMYYQRAADKAYLHNSDFYLYDPNAEPIFLIENNNLNYAPQIRFKTGSPTAVQFTLGVDPGDVSKFKIYSGTGITGTSEFVMTGTGKVGIGLASPSVLLEVAGAAAFEDNAADPNGSGDIVITLPQCRRGVLTDKDLTGNADFILNTKDASLSLQILIVNGTYTISVVPPTGEKLWMDGAALDANDEIDLSSNEGDKFDLKRRYSASSADYVWDLETVRGTASDGGVGD